jgi:S-adenosylmethionine hydrolase
VDLTHGIERGDLLGGALVVEEARRWFPPGTVFVVVVDPGVGTDRRPLAARAGGRYFVGPDNGVLWPCLASDPRAAVREIRNPRFRLPEVSDTFHGRDVFAPAAARLAAGRPLASAGPEVRDPRRLPGFEADRRGGSLRGQVLRVDRFGNLVTSVTARDLSMTFDETPFATLDIRVGGRRVDESARTYGLARPGVPFALLGSGGRLEIAVRDGSAADALACGRGMPVTVERRGGRR